jgi:hypothetical protein
MSSARELQDELARLDASITVLERVPSLSERAQRDLAAQRARRAEIAAALRELRDSPGP